VPWASQRETWTLPRDEKKELYGKYQVPVGGKESDAEDEDEEETGPSSSSKKAKVDPKEEAPVFYWQPSGKLCDEIIWMYSAIGVIDLTAGSGQWAMSALRSSIPYFGVVLTPCHMARLRQWLVKQVSEGMKDDTSGLRHLSGRTAVLKKPTPKDKVKKPTGVVTKEKGAGEKEKEKKVKKKRKKSDEESASGSDSGEQESESETPME
jgi:hypothetical protein